MYSLDVELNSDSEGKMEQNGCLLGTRAGKNTRGQWTIKVQNGHEAEVYPTTVNDTDFYRMECKENPAAVLAFVLQLHLLKASFW